MDLLWLGGEGPQDIPSWAYMHLVTKLGVPPERLTSLRSVQKAGFWDDRPVTFARVFAPPTRDDTFQVQDFTSLDDHPELIIYEGHWERGGDRVHFEIRAAPGSHSRNASSAATS